MSIVDLKSRLTLDWNAFNEYMKSSDSLICIDGPIILADDGPAAVDLSIGDRWLDHRDNTQYLIPKEGLHLKPNQSTVVVTQQRIALPLNVFGLVTGKGKYIFQGVFISSGKVDPGYNGRLKIGLYNGSEHTIVLKTGEPFYSCCFFQMESSLDAPLRSYETEPTLRPSHLPRRVRIANWLKVSWKAIIPMIISLVAVIVALLK